MRLDQSVTELFVCPRCRGDLAARRDESGRLLALECAACASTFPMVGDIPRFVPSDTYAASFGMQWNRHRRTQLDSYTGLPVSRQRLFSSTGWPEHLDGERLLEAGSGAGRFTEGLLTTGALVYSFDYSTAVEANYASHGNSDRLCLFQGDIFQIPLKAQAFDKVLCIGVLQHTPDPEGAFKSLARYVRPGGELVVDVYAKRLTAVVSWKYLLRPITRRMDRERLYGLVMRAVDALLPLAVWLRRVGGRVGARLLPITEYRTSG